MRRLAAAPILAAGLWCCVPLGEVDARRPSTCSVSQPSTPSPSTSGPTTSSTASSVPATDATPTSTTIGSASSTSAVAVDIGSPPVPPPSVQVAPPASNITLPATGRGKTTARFAFGGVLVLIGGGGLLLMARRGQV